MARKTRKQRGGRSAENIQKNINQKEQELADLRAELKALTPNANDSQLAPFKKMQSMGIPEGAIRQKMSMAGINAARLFGGPSATSKPAVSALPFTGLNLASRPLRATGGPQKRVVNAAATAAATAAAPKGQMTFAAEIAASGPRLRRVAQNPQPQFRELPNIRAKDKGWQKLTDGRDVWFWNPTTGVNSWDPPY